MDSLQDSAIHLANAHREADPSTTEIFLAPDPEGREIRLVEISHEMAPTREIIPIRFKSDPEDGIHYPSTIIVLSPEEWEECRTGSLALPWGRPDDFQKIA